MLWRAGLIAALALSPSDATGPAPLGPGCGQAVELFPNGAPFEVPGAVGPEVWSDAGHELHVYNVTRPTITYHCANRSNPNLYVLVHRLTQSMSCTQRADTIKILPVLCHLFVFAVVEAVL